MNSFLRSFWGMVEGGIQPRTLWMQSKSLNNELLHTIMCIAPVIQQIWRVQEVLQHPKFMFYHYWWHVSPITMKNEVRLDIYIFKVALVPWHDIKFSHLLENVCCKGYCITFGSQCMCSVTSLSTSIVWPSTWLTMEVTIKFELR